MDLVVLHADASLAAEAREWRLAQRTAAALFVLPFLGGALLVALMALYEPLYAFLLEEDSLVEWGTAAVFASTAALAVALARALWLRALRSQAVVYGLVAVVAFAAAGEEISWGQRLFGFDGPEALTSANLQEEVTFHNLSGVYQLYLLAQLLVGLYGSLGSWWVYRRSSRPPGPNARLFVPPLFLSSAFLLLALYRIGREVVVPVSRFGEWLELSVASAVAVFVILNLRRLRSEDGARRPGL